MEKKTKIIIGIGAALVAAAGIYIAIKKPFKTKEKDTDPASSDAAPEEKTKEVEEKQLSRPAITVKKSKPTSTVKHAPAPVTKTTTKPVTQTGPPPMGTKLFAHIDMNAYTEPVANRSKLFKFYRKGAYIGTYLAPASGVFSKVIVQVTNTGFAALANPVSNKTVYIRTNEISI